MALFDAVHFNGEVFGEYIDQIPDTHLNMLINSGAVVRDQSVADAFSQQTGAFVITTPLYDSIMDVEPDNYDGMTDISTHTQSTYAYKRVVHGRAKGFTEKDFANDITAGNYSPLENAARQVDKWKMRNLEHSLYATADGFFKIPAMANKHTYNATGMTNSQGVAGNVDATTLNSAMQKACGDGKKMFALAIMHSAVATNLENLNLLTFITYTDQNGIERNTDFAKINGKLVLVDDGVTSYEDESTATYAKTSDSALATGKTYYTRSGSSGNYVYTAVDEPNVSDIGNYYEKTQEGKTVYNTFVFGEGAIKYTDCGVAHPYSVSRDESKNGGEETLWVRYRASLAPYGISFVGEDNIASLSPTNAELADGNNWALVSTGGVNAKAIDDKAIPIARVLSYG